MMENLAIAVREKYKFQKHAAIGMGIDGGNLSNLIKKGDPSKLRGETLVNLERGFPEYNLDWLLEKSSIKLKKDADRLSNVKPSPDGNGMLLKDGRIIGRVHDMFPYTSFTVNYVFSVFIYTHYCTQ